ncbi:hypothetical protein ACFSHT_22245 [Paraburkholderia silviterrae]|nr:hypothetical protein [Paraburkholderia silviterrae]
MKPHIYKRGRWHVRVASSFYVTFSFASFEGACRWAKRIAD